MKLFKNIKIIWIWLILICSLILVGVKTYYITEHLRYISYGLDSPRIIGYTQSLVQLGRIDNFSSNRVGLPLFAAALVKIFSLPPSQTLLLPLWIMSLGSVLVVFFLTQILTKKIEYASTAAMLYAMNFIPVQINDSHFMALLVAPLRILIILWFLANQNKKLDRIFGYLSVLGISILANSTYPILALIADIMIFLILIIRWLSLKKNVNKLVWVLGSQIIAYIWLFLFYELIYEFKLPLLKFVERTYSLALTSIDNQTALALVGSFFSLQVLSLILLLKKPKIRISLAFKRIKDKIWLKRLIFIITLYFLLVATLNILTVVFPGEVIWRQLLPILLKIPAEDEQLFVWTFLLSLVTISTFKLKNRDSIDLKTIGVFTFLYVALMFLFRGYGEGNIMENSRMIAFFIPYAILFSALGIHRLEKNPKILILGILVITLGSSSLLKMKKNFSLGGERPILSAMDWFIQQPNHNSVLFFARYYQSNRLTPHEKIDGLYFSPSIVPHEDQVELARCDISPNECVKKYQTYVQENDLNYLVIEDGEDTLMYGELSKLGEIIYDNQVRIIKL